LLLVKPDFRLGVDRRMIHELLIDMVIKLVECALYTLEKLMKTAVEYLLHGEEVKIGKEFAEVAFFLTSIFTAFLPAEPVKFPIKPLEAIAD
jgi:hypothetical protein